MVIVNCRITGIKGTSEMSVTNQVNFNTHREFFEKII